MNAPQPPPNGLAELLTIEEAAARINRRPFDVVALIHSGKVRTVTLVDATSLPEKKP